MHVLLWILDPCLLCGFSLHWHFHLRHGLGNLFGFACSNRLHYVNNLTIKGCNLLNLCSLSWVYSNAVWFESVLYLIDSDMLSGISAGIKDLSYNMNSAVVSLKDSLQLFITSVETHISQCKKSLIQYFCISCCSTWCICYYSQLDISRVVNIAILYCNTQDCQYRFQYCQSIAILFENIYLYWYCQYFF